MLCRDSVQKIWPVGYSTLTGSFCYYSKPVTCYWQDLADNATIAAWWRGSLWSAAFMSPGNRNHSGFWSYIEAAPRQPHIGHWMNVWVTPGTGEAICLVFIFWLLKIVWAWNLPHLFGSCILHLLQVSVLIHLPWYKVVFIQMLHVFFHEMRVR